MSYKELVKKLRLLGCKEIPRRGRGSHRKWQVIKVDSATARRIIEDFEILFAITDETGIKKFKMKYF